MLRETKFANWLYTGQRAVLELLEAVRTGVGSLSAYHLQWVTRSGVYQYGSASHEHKILIEVIRKAFEIDQIDVSNLTFAEDIIRRLIQIEVAVARSLAQLDFTGLDELLEAPVDASGRASATGIDHWLTERLKTKANIQKQSGLFKEEFSGHGARQQGSGGGGGDGRGRGRGGGRKGDRKGRNGNGASSSSNKTVKEADEG